MEDRSVWTRDFFLLHQCTSFSAVSRGVEPRKPRSPALARPALGLGCRELRFCSFGLAPGAECVAPHVCFAE